MRIMVKKPTQLLMARFKKGMSIRKLSELSNVNPSTILRLEKGISNPNPATAKAISDALSMDVESIFSLEGE